MIRVRIACDEYSGNVLLLPRNPLSQTDAGVVPLDNLCQIDINSPRSKRKRNHNPRDCGLFCFTSVLCSYRLHELTV